MMTASAPRLSTSVEPRHVPTRMPSHVPSGAVLLAIELGEEARGITGLDVLRRSVDRAPPTHS